MGGAPQWYGSGVISRCTSFAACVHVFGMHFNLCGQSITNGIRDQNEKKRINHCVCVCGGRPEKVKRNLYKNYDANSSCTSECDS